MSDIKCEIHEIVEVLEENEGNNWATVLARVSWNDGPVRLEIRCTDLSKIDSDKKMVKKVGSLSDEGYTKLLYKLIEIGYGDKKKIKNLLKERESSIFGDEDEEYEMEDFDLNFDEEDVKRIKVRRIRDWYVNR